MSVSGFGVLAARGLRAILATSALLAWAGSAAAQARTPSRAVPEAASDTIALGAVVGEAEPRGFVVVAVPLPAEVGESGTISYEVAPAAAVSLLSPRSGRLDPLRSGSLLLTFGVPADAAAGPAEAAVVTFTAEGRSAPVRVPVTLVVARVRGVALDAPPLVTGLYPGGRGEVTVRITNTGNLADTVTVEADWPEAWESAQGSRRLVLPRGRTEPVAFRIDVPEGAGTGDFFLDVRVRAEGADSLADAVVRMNVAEQSAATGLPGPSVRAALALVAGTGAESGGSAIELEAQGPVAGGWSVDGRATVLAGPQSTTTLRGLARVGSYVTSPTMRLWSQSSSVTAGNVQFPGGELTGANAYGRGISASHRTGSLGAFDLLAARAQVGARGDEGLFLGMRHSAVWRGFGFATTAASLEADRRRLDAFGLDVESPEHRLGEAELGLAYRDHGDGAGIGFRALARHSREDRHLELHAMHAPGGSRAFATARDRVGASASLQVVPRWSVGGDFLLTRDENTVLRSIDSRSWTLFQQLRARPMTTLRLELRGSSFDGRGDDLAFGTEELTLSGGVSSLRGAWFYSATGALARLARSVDQEPLGHVETEGPQVSFSGVAGWAGNDGRVQMELRHQRTEPGMGYLSQQLTLGASAERIRTTVADWPLLLNGSILHTSWGGRGGDGATVLRGGATLPIDENFEASVGVERNPFFRTPSGDASWVFSMRLERRAVLPRIGLGSSDGFVFQDLDGNGRRDPGEPGMPGATVRRAGQSATTDATGAYRFTGPAQGDVLVDVGSLPAGWLLGAEAGGGGDIGVVPASQVRIQLELVPSPLFAIRPPNLGAVDVLAVDRGGREWLGRRVGEGVVFFDALPAGEYTLLIDATRAEEPLRPADGEPTVRIVGGAPTTLNVRLEGRPVRIGGGRDR